MPTKKAKKKAARLDPRGYATESIPRAPSKESEAERAFPVTCALAVRPGGTVRVTARARVQLSSPSGSRATGFSPQVISQGMPEHLEPFQHGNSRAVETKARTIGVKSTPSPRPRFVAPAFCPIPELDLSPMAETDVPSAKSTRLKPANESRSVPPGNTGIGTSLLGISDEIFPRLSTEGSAQPEDAAVTGDHESSADFPVPEASQPAITRKWHSDDRSPPLFGALVQSPTGACLLVSSSAPSTPQMRPSAWPALPLSAACAGTPSVAGTDASMAREALVSPALSMTTCEVACDAHHADHVDASASGLSDAEFAAKLAEQLDDEDAAAGEGEAPIEEEGVMCAICHGNIQPLEVALVHGCDHPFCCGCILNWALQKQRCPLCQVQFTHLWMYKQLDGTFNDYLREESVALLHRAMWFRKAVVTEFSPQTHADDDDEYHDYLQYEYGGRRDEEDEEMYYIEMQERVALGRSGRRAFGNRMFGAGGVVQGGRMKARPVPVTPKWSGKKVANGGSAWSECELPVSKQGSSSVSSGLGLGQADSPNSETRLSKKAEAKAAKVAQKEAMKERRREMARAVLTPRKGSSM